MRTDKPPRIAGCFRFQLWEALVFTSLVAALFAVGRLIDTTLHQLPHAPEVSLAFARKQISDGHVDSMTMSVVDDVMVGYAELSGLAVSDDSEERAPMRTFMVRMPNGTGASIRTLLQDENIPFRFMGSPDPGFAWKYPLAGTAFLFLAAVVYLRFKNLRPQAADNVGGTCHK